MFTGKVSSGVLGSPGTKSHLLAAESGELHGLEHTEWPKDLEQGNITCYITLSSYVTVGTQLWPLEFLFAPP